MLTPDQKEWINSLSTEKIIKIFPFDPTAEEKFQKIKAQIHNVLGNDIPVMHRGSSSLGILGQDEIDVYIPVEPDGFPVLQPQLEELFGTARSVLPAQRIRFYASVDDKHIDLFLINKHHRDWIEGVAFEEKCKSNPQILEAYRKLKEGMDGVTVQECYRQKAEFIDQVLHGET
jgi:GrpB-like predicted nucleotidyltransferase (UPF0157 family)